MQGAELNTRTLSQHLNNIVLLGVGGFLHGRYLRFAFSAPPKIEPQLRYWFHGDYHRGIQLLEMALQQWALPRLQGLLPLDEGELEQIVSYASKLSDSETVQHLENLLGDSPQSLAFITSFVQRRAELHAGRPTDKTDNVGEEFAAPTYPPPSFGGQADGRSSDSKNTTHSSNEKASMALAANSDKGLRQQNSHMDSAPPAYAPSPGPWPAGGPTFHRPHTNEVNEAGKLRARDEVRSGSCPKRHEVAAALIDSLAARNAATAAKSSIPVSHL